MFESFSKAEHQCKGVNLGMYAVFQNAYAVFFLSEILTGHS